VPSNMAFCFSIRAGFFSFSFDSDSDFDDLAASGTRISRIRRLRELRMYVRLGCGENPST
jgi:hypothetical protein